MPIGAAHFMFGPAYTAGCPVCSSAADTFDGAVPHLNARNVMFTCISRAPLDKLQAYKRRMGWSFPWASSHGSDDNFDLEVSRPEEATREFLSAAPRCGRPARAECGTQPAAYLSGAPVLSAYALEGGTVHDLFHERPRAGVPDGLRFSWTAPRPLLASGVDGLAAAGEEV